ncbi:hypothetical protein JCM17843_03430 [Kordiimonadales bacterium JCM 17843]|nr:hypothetical protein JCM17843_03430 [Kordiimonadales bacterium JCM 17843]
MPQGIGTLVARAGAFRGRLADLLPGQSARRRFWDRLFDTTNPQSLVGLDDDSFTHHLEKLAQDARTADKQGTPMALCSLWGQAPAIRNC